MLSLKKRQGRILPILVGTIAILFLGFFSILVFSSPVALTWSGLDEWLVWALANLLLIAVAVAIIGFLFYRKPRANEPQIDPVPESPAVEVKDERVQETVLQNYLDNMTKLLLEKNLRRAGEDSEVRSLARARTMTTIRGLDDDRKAR
ncbi:MAG: hypothetical protein OES12_11200, partial [Anaerolineae bacterium]|nr:hypothetical protein [Anaerolineae bacterium]